MICGSLPSAAFPDGAGSITQVEAQQRHDVEVPHLVPIDSRLSDKLVTSVPLRCIVIRGYTRATNTTSIIGRHGLDVRRGLGSPRLSERWSLGWRSSTLVFFTRPGCGGGASSAAAKKVARIRAAVGFLMRSRSPLQRRAFDGRASLPSISRRNPMPELPPPPAIAA